MTTVHHAHHRPSPPHMKKTGLRTRCPNPLPKIASTTRIAGPKSPKAVKDAEALEEDEAMATSFLQFCAMCEKQIIVPNNSILYCSESCRRKDSVPSPNLTSHVGIMSAPASLSYDTESFRSKPRELIPRLKPTPSPATAAQIPTLSPTFKSDLDPTEWKPAEGRPRSFKGRPKLEHRPSSEAFQYLSQFHPTTSARRPDWHTRARTNTGMTSTPSLSYTPTTSTSSSPNHSPISPTGSAFELLSPRPLPPSHSSTAIKSADLVTPLPYAFGACTGEKRPVTAGKVHDGMPARSPLAELKPKKKWG